MPRLDDPTIKLKQKKSFVRKSLRPWDNPNDFIPNKNNNVLKKKEALNTSSSDNYLSTPIVKQSPQNQLVNNKETNSKQKGNNRETIGNQLVNNKETNSKQKGNNRETKGNQLVNNKVNSGKTKGKQTVSETAHFKQEDQTTVYEETLNTIRGLFGLQKTALFCIVENCKSRGLLYTSPLTNEFFRNALKTDVNSVKTTIQRLIKKGLICRKAAKKGKGGYTIFSIQATVRNATIEITKQLDIDGQRQWEFVINRETIGNQLVNNKVNNKVNSASVVSSSYINTTTNGLPEEWDNIEISSLEEIGFRGSHLIQIYQAYQQAPEKALTAEMVQESIDALAFDLKHNADKLKTKIQKPLVALISMLKKGSPWSSITPEKFVTPHQEAMNAYTKMKELQQQNTIALEQKMKELEFKEWQANLTEEKLLSFSIKTEADFKGIPENLHKTFRRRDAVTVTKDYFDAEVWPIKREEIMSKITTGNQALTANNEELATI